MNAKMLGRVLSPLLILEAIFLIPAYVISRTTSAMQATSAIFDTMILLVAISFVLYFYGKKEDIHKLDSVTEGLAITGISWIVVSLLGCLPFYLSNEIPHYVDAVFEMVSGFTTTGASILTNCEHMSKGLLYWRSFSHWIGGMGALIFLTALMPEGKNHFNNTVETIKIDSPQPPSTKLLPRIHLTSKILFTTYMVLTLLDFICLVVSGMPVFDALCVAYSTSGTGGFGVKNTSMTSYGAQVQSITTVFMLLFGINFSCFYLLFAKRMKEVFKDEELGMYGRIVIVSTILIAFNIAPMYKDYVTTLRYSLFQVASMITTTGFAVVDYNTWPVFSKMILLFLMFSGACAGSTGGGIKIARILMLKKSLKRSFQKGLVDESDPIVVNGNTVSEMVMKNVYKYLVAYITIVAISILILSLDGYSMETNISAVMACFNNIGPGLGKVGPSGTYAIYGSLSKVVLIIDMLAGRLEIYPIMILLTQRGWIKKVKVPSIINET